MSCAALLAVKLPHLDADIAHRRQIADFYQHELAGLPLVLPKVRAGAEPVWYLLWCRANAVMPCNRRWPRRVSAR